VKQIVLGGAIGVGGWLAVSAGISWYLQTRHSAAPIDTLGIATMAGLVGCVGVGLLKAAYGSWRERRAIAGGIAGLRPVDGRGAVLVGRIQPQGLPLKAPLDGADCVTYTYEVSEETGSGRHRAIATHFKGVALTPSTILTTSGSYRLLAVPDLVEADEASGSPSDHIAAFERYARATSFIGRDDAARELLDRWTDGDGAYRSDVAYAILDHLKLVHCRLEQRHIRPGAPIAVFGTFSTGQGGIVPTTGLGGNPRLVQGDLQQLVAVLGSTARTRLILGMLASAASVGLVAAFSGNG
jgi:hypothetical protein